MDLVHDGGGEEYQLQEDRKGELVIARGFHFRSKWKFVF